MTDNNAPLSDADKQAILDREELDHDPDYQDGAGSLVAEIAALNVLLGEQVPEMNDSIVELGRSIEILQNQSVTHKESKRRTIRSIAFVLIVGFLATIGSIYLILGVAIPKCFLSKDITHVSQSCNYIPNFKRTKAQDVALIAVLKKAQTDLYNEIRQGQLRQNSSSARINQLQQEIITLDKELGKPVPKQLPPAPVFSNPVPSPSPKP